MPNPDGTPTVEELAQKVRDADAKVDDASSSEDVQAGKMGGLTVAGGATGAVGGAALAGVPSLGIGAPLGAAIGGTAGAIAGFSTGVGDYDKARGDTNQAVRDAEAARRAYIEAGGTDPALSNIEDVEYNARPWQTDPARAFEEEVQPAVDYVAEQAEAGYDYVAEQAEAGYEAVSEGVSDAYDATAQGVSDAVDYVEETWENLDLNPFDDE